MRAITRQSYSCALAHLPCTDSTVPVETFHAAMLLVMRAWGWSSTTVIQLSHNIDSAFWHSAFRAAFFIQHSGQCIRHSSVWHSKSPIRHSGIWYSDPYPPHIGFLPPGHLLLGHLPSRTCAPPPYMSLAPRTSAPSRTSDVVLL